jgi:hypothetical protein
MWALMKKDSLIETAGEWTRWPLGSIYLFGSVFNTSETYKDHKVEQYKKKAKLSFFFNAWIACTISHGGCIFSLIFF